MNISKLPRFIHRKIFGVQMAQLTYLEEKIYNEGERLIPGVTHDIKEVIRHKSSYNFFHKVIEDDLNMVSNQSNENLISIADLGCGVGHGCKTLSSLNKSSITGVDFSQESLEYAEQHYAGKNISYKLAELNKFIQEMPEYDYVVSRGVFEHVPNGIVAANSTNWRQRLLFDVPYDEPEDINHHHLISSIREEHFDEFTESELFFQDLAGVIYDPKHKPKKPNMIICICSHPDLPKIKNRNISFPVPAWKP